MFKDRIYLGYLKLYTMQNHKEFTSDFKCIYVSMLCIYILFLMAGEEKIILKSIIKFVYKIWNAQYF